MRGIFKKIIVKILTWQALFLLKRNNPKIIAITGNLGKTSTKDSIYAALHKNLLNENGESLVLASKKSMNSDFGVPLTILGMESGWANPFLWFKIILNGFVKMFDKFPYKYLILEIGADMPGDIKKVCEFIKPDIVVLTAFAEVPVHIEFFDNKRESLVKEKKHLVENLKNQGTFIYNLDDEDCVNIAKEMEGRDIFQKSFSLKNPEADIFAKDIKIESESVNKFVTKVAGVSGEVFLKNDDKYSVKVVDNLGQAIFYSILPAILIAEIFDVDIEKAIKDIEKNKETKGRMRLLEGVYNSTIIDDTYNSSPKALKHGIEVVKSLDIGEGKKIFVIGDMLELGDFTKQEHERIGEMLVNIADILIVSGVRAKFIGEAAIAKGMNKDNVYFASGSLEAGRKALTVLEGEIEKDYKAGRSESESGGDLVFIKGSQGARMEKVARILLNREMHDPEEVLVRQEKVWERK
ncbi:MAG: Mur ligase family protein [Candidatus Pacebacteria bacterium]|jgi:UDP-N-acetylmuramyl pentapeptide synthase|nr:Mur ligase family protein [Candidatus Paceibacterota bacterium]